MSGIFLLLDAVYKGPSYSHSSSLSCPFHSVPEQEQGKTWDNNCQIMSRAGSLHQFSFSKPDQSKNSHELLKALSCKDHPHNSPTGHDKDYPICGEFVVDSCTLSLQSLWRIHQCNLSAVPPLEDVFSVDLLLEFLKAK